VFLAQAGAGALLAGLALAAFAALLSFWAGRREEALLALVGRRAFWAAAGAVVVASLCLEAAFLTHDFSILFVATHSDLATPVPLLAAAFYSGQEGSLLYWTLVLAVLGSASLAGLGGARLPAYATGVLAALLAFFLVVLAFVAPPFATLALAPPDGLGLNPILRDGGMLIHPPFLLAGFSSFAVPFSFAIASLLAGRVDAAWIAHTRRLALLAWGLQSAGLTLGMWWAYHVLGWGGYWGWDPVENVALLPWLATTAYLHSAQVQERRGMLQSWNFGLVILAYCLAVFGTFVVRSGIIQSVHSFALSAIGPWFLALLAVLVLRSPSGASRPPTPLWAPGRVRPVQGGRVPTPEPPLPGTRLRGFLGNHPAARLGPGERSPGGGRTGLLRTRHRASLPGHPRPPGGRASVALEASRPSLAAASAGPAGRRRLRARGPARSRRA